jgi:uncharacterized membrane protein
MEALPKGFSEFYYSEALFPTIWAIILVALGVSVIYFIDGVRKYAYWLKKDEGEV